MTLPTSRDCRDLSSCQLSISQHSAPLAIFSRQILTCGAGLVGVKILVKVWAGGSGLCWAWLITGTTATPHHYSDHQLTHIAAQNSDGDNFLNFPPKLSGEWGEARWGESSCEVNREHLSWQAVTQLDKSHVTLQPSSQTYHPISCNLGNLVPATTVLVNKV